MTRPIVVGTRGSALALWQANTVADAFRAADPATSVEVRVVKTKGDKILDVALSKIGDKGLFTKELENLLLSGEVDVCVHSMKDMPTVLPAGCTLAAMLSRADARDVLACAPALAHVRSLDELPEGARLGTGSLRRTAQLRAKHPQVEPCEIRGNLDTRLAKAESGEFDGVVLAAAGIDRMGWSDRISCFIDPDDMIPAVGQGAIGIEAREDDPRTAALCAAVAHADTMACVCAERLIMRELEGGCQVPIGAYARLVGGFAVMDALVSSLDGQRQARSHREAPCDPAAFHGNPHALEQLARDVLADLEAQGARAILDDVRAQAEVEA